MKATIETKDEAANFIFAYHSNDPFMTQEQHEHGISRLQRQQQLLDYIYSLILNDIKNDNKSN
jgi:hypothetical protein